VPRLGGLGRAAAALHGPRRPPPHRPEAGTLAAASREADDVRGLPLRSLRLAAPTRWRTLSLARAAAASPHNPPEHMEAYPVSPPDWGGVERRARVA